MAICAHVRTVDGGSTCFGGVDVSLVAPHLMLLPLFFSSTAGGIISGIISLNAH